MEQTKRSAAKKLGIHSAGRVTVCGASPEDVGALLGELPDGAVTNTGAGERGDTILFFAYTVDGVRDGVRAAHEHVNPVVRLWVAYRKGASRSGRPGGGEVLHRDTLQAALAERGLTGISLIALDDVWSAMRVRPADNM